MTSRRILVATIVTGLALAVAGCSEEQTSADSTAPSSSADSTTTTVVDTTAASTSTSSSTTTSTSTTAAPTTTTLKPVEGLGLNPDGLGSALFGADPDQTISYVQSILGPSTNDSGWVDPVEVGAACPGTQIRFVDWNDLSLFFTDESPAATGLRHFASYTYGPAINGATISPFGLVTAGGVGVGGTVEFLRAAHPSVQIHPGDDINGPSFSIAESLIGFLTGSSNSDTIISFVGGYGCGE